MEEVTHLREERVAVYQSACKGVSLGRQLPPPVPPRLKIHFSENIFCKQLFCLCASFEELTATHTSVTAVRVSEGFLITVLLSLLP